MGILALVMLLAAWEPEDDCRRTYLLDTEACTAEYRDNLDTNTPLADGTLSACLEGARRDYQECTRRVWDGLSCDA
jgi:hypothetical protein